MKLKLCLDCVNKKTFPPLHFVIKWSRNGNDITYRQQTNLKIEQNILTVTRQQKEKEAHSHTFCDLCIVVSCEQPAPFVPKQSTQSKELKKSLFSPVRSVQIIFSNCDNLWQHIQNSKCFKVASQFSAIAKYHDNQRNFHLTLQVIGNQCSTYFDYNFFDIFSQNCGWNDDVLIDFGNSRRFCFLWFFVNVSFCSERDGSDDLLMAFGDNSSSLIVFPPYILVMIFHCMKR